MAGTLTDPAKVMGALVVCEVGVQRMKAAEAAAQDILGVAGTWAAAAEELGSVDEDPVAAGKVAGCEDSQWCALAHIFFAGLEAASLDFDTRLIVRRFGFVRSGRSVDLVEVVERKGRWRRST